MDWRELRFQIRFFGFAAVAKQRFRSLVHVIRYKMDSQYRDACDYAASLYYDHRNCE